MASGHRSSCSTILFALILTFNLAAQQDLLERAEALDRSGKHEAAAQLISTLLERAGNDPGQLFAIGMTCGRIHMYAQAETAFSEVLKHDPDDFDVLYNLGLAAARASHYERARGAFETALKQHPKDLDTLYQLGRVEEALHNYPRAVYLLVQAHQQAPQRLDIILALARTTQFAGFYGDSILAYDEYLKLRPDDDLVRRDRALVVGFSRDRLEEGLTDLRSYVKKYPRDGVGYYNLAQLAGRVDRAEALRYVSIATEVSPEFEKAHYYRAWLLEELGRFEESAVELQQAISLDAHDVRAMDLLGLDYLNLGQAARAEVPLRTALALEPDDHDILFHLSRVLIETGRAAEARPLLEKFKAMPARRQASPTEEAGMIEAASLPSSELTRRLLDQLHRDAAWRPADATVKLHLASVLLAAGQADDALKVFHELLALNPEPDVLEKAGNVLLQFDQQALAREFLDRAAAARGHSR